MSVAERIEEMVYGGMQDYQEGETIMRKTWNPVAILLAATLTGALLAGCGSSSSAAKESVRESGGYYDDEAVAYAAEAAPEAYYTDDVYETADMAEESGSTEAEIIDEGAVATDRKLIKNVNLNVETEEFDKFLANIEAKVQLLGGYIENSEISGRSLYNTTSNRYASITARVPNTKLDTFITTITEQSNITSKSLSTEDVTLQYADTKAHIESLKTEQKRLNDLIEKAEDLDTILTLEARLTEVSYQVESYERQIRSMDNKVDYSTVYIYVDEVTHYTPVEQEPLSAGERMAQGLSENLYKIGHGLSEFGINFVIALPFIILTLVILGLIALVVILIVKGALKASAKSAAKRQQMMQQNPQGARPMQQGKPVQQVKPVQPVKPAQPAKPPVQTQNGEKPEE